MNINNSRQSVMQLMMHILQMRYRAIMLTPNSDWPPYERYDVWLNNPFDLYLKVRCYSQLDCPEGLMLKVLVDETGEIRVKLECEMFDFTRRPKMWLMPIRGFFSSIAGIESATEVDATCRHENLLSVIDAALAKIQTINWDEEMNEFHID